MADIADPNASPTHDETTGNGADARGVKRPRVSTAPDDDDEDDERGGRERRKIDIKFIQDKSRRHITFSKRKAGIMKKVGAYSTHDHKMRLPFAIVHGRPMLTYALYRHMSCLSLPAHKSSSLLCQRLD